MSPTLSYETLFRTVLYPAYNKIIGRNGIETFRDRKISQYLPRDTLDKIQLSKLKTVLVNARNRVPYYREEFKRIGFVPEDLKRLSEFGKVEFFIDKAIVRDNTTAFLADGHNPKALNWHRTGGSTGTPLHFPTDKATDAASAASIMKALDWWGIQIGSRHAMFWGSPTFIKRRKGDTIRQWGNIVRNRLMNRQFFLNYNISDQNVESIFHAIERFKPEYIRGMPTSLAIFAKLAQKRGLKLQHGRPKVMHSACEQLFDWQKEVIEEVFGAPLLNTYGLSEVCDIAYQAPCGELHIMDEDVLLELFPFLGGEQEIVTTQLNNLSSPLIRYRTGDIAEAIAPCTCGLNSFTLKGLKGRAHDFILAPNGRFLHGQFLTHILVYEKGIRKYQVVQRTRKQLRIKLLVEEDFDKSCMQRIASAIASYMGDEMEINFELVDEIPLTAAGKHRWIVSELGSLDQQL